MKIDPPLKKGIFIKRYKRFFADIEQSDGSLLTVHCPNTGSMKNCLVAGTPCWYSLSDNPKRKLAGTLELVTTQQGFIAGTNTSRPNHLVEEAIMNGNIPQLSGYASLKREVRYGEERSRIDLLLDGSLQRPSQPCYVEVKNVTLEAGGDSGCEASSEGLMLFPDARTARGTKHLRELMSMVEKGFRAVLVFCVQHSGAEVVAPADNIDPEYGETLREAAKAGVELLAYRCELSVDEVVISRQLPIVC